MGRALDEQLRACAPGERPPLVGADRGIDAQGPQDRERPACDRRLREIELKPKLASSEEVHRARRVEQRGDLGEPVAAPLRRDGRELGAGVRDQRPVAHRRVCSSASKRRFRVFPPEPYPPSSNGSSLPAATTRWQGTTSDQRFRAQKVPAARAARGRPARAASPPYVTTSPHPTERAAARSSRWNGVRCPSSRTTSSYATGIPSRCAAKRRHRLGTRSSPSCDGLPASVKSGVLVPPLRPPA